MLKVYYSYFSLSTYFLYVSFSKKHKNFLPTIRKNPPFPLSFSFLTNLLPLIYNENDNDYYY